MAGSAMEVDPPTSSSLPSTSLSMPGTLKRSNSAPMINILSSMGPQSDPGPLSLDSCGPSPSTPSTSHASVGRSVSESIATPGPSQLQDQGPQSGRPGEIQRIRRFSASCSVGLHSPTGKIPSRLDQIKHEESIAVSEREAAHERELQSTMQISHSWEELTLVSKAEEFMMDEAMVKQQEEAMVTESKRPKSFGEPLHIFTSPFPYSSSPSPTRVGKQCFSPSLQQPVKNSTLTPSPTPSPTRKSFRRSLSPITLRPSPLSGIKRKMELEDSERIDNYFSPPKRFFSGPTTPERPIVSHSLIHCISSGNLDDSGSPEQQVPNMVSRSHSADMQLSTATTTPASCFTFRPVRDSIDTHGTDSDASEMAETTDISEQNDASCGSESSPGGAFASVKPSSL